jgi:hypothetical protein
VLTFLGLLAIAISIFGAAWFLTQRIITVRSVSGYLVPKELMPQKPGVTTTDEGQKRPSRRARDLVG